jgi:hypothetical protein
MVGSWLAVTLECLLAQDDRRPPMAAVPPVTGPV